MNAGDSADFSIESEFTFPLYDQEGYDLGTAKFFYPAREDLPISVISILSQNMGKELNKSLRQILNNTSSVEANVAKGWLELQITQRNPMEALPKP